MPEDKTPEVQATPQLEAALGERWLGDYKLINSLLRSFAFKNLDRAGQGDADAFAAKLDASARNLAQTLLGHNEKYPGPKWFSPGMIDVYVARQASIASDDPEERIAGALIGMAAELLELAQSTSGSNLLGEQWQWQATATIDSYARMMLGIPGDAEPDEEGDKEPSPKTPLKTPPPQVKPSPFSSRK